MYVLSYFRTQAEALHLAVSEDGLRGRALKNNQPILTGTVGARTLRDPFVFREEPSGASRFHLFATDGWRSDGIVHAVSEDLLHWSEQKRIPIMAHVPGTRNCWAPECFYDLEKRLYRVIWSSTVRESEAPDTYDHRIWGTTTTDFLTYSAPEPFFDPGYNVIDATIVRHGNGYLMAFKDERGENRRGTDWKAIRVCFSNHARGPWTEISDLITPSLTEGPALFRRGDRWVMLFDHFTEDFFGALQSADGRRWEAVTEELSFPDGLRHATVLEVPEAVGQKLLYEAAE